jgi:hypothetical protein
MMSPAGGHQDGLTAMVQTRIGSGLKGGFELMMLHIAQGQFHHDIILPGDTPGRLPALRRTKVLAACIGLPPVMNFGKL